MVSLCARVRDISKHSEKKERLEVYFYPADSSYLPSHHEDAVHLEFPTGVYVAKIGLTETNPPYLQGSLAGPTGDTTCTKVLQAVGCGHGDAILFEVARPRRRLRFLKVLPGKGPPLRRGPRKAGNIQESRSKSSSGSKPPTRQPREQGNTVNLEILDRKTVLHWAKEYWRVIGADDAENERKFEQLLPVARKDGFLSKALFEDISKWKSRQRLDLIQGNSAKLVKACTQAAFKVSNHAEAIIALKRLDGVALRRAVALLHWMRPNEFPIIDERVVEIIGWPKPGNWESIAYYDRFADHLAKHARRLKVDFRTLDRAIWTMHKASGAKLSG